MCKVGEIMNFFERLLIILDAEMPRPTLFGWFHILCLIHVFYNVVLFQVA